MALSMYIKEVFSLSKSDDIMTSKKVEHVMKRIYYDPSHEGSFGGVEKLKKAVHEETGKKPQSGNVEEWLSAQNAYTLHKPARKVFPRNRVFSPRPLYQFQADLCDMSSLSKHNDGKTFLLTCIDIFSKKAYSRALKNKSGPEVARAFASVLEESGIPYKIQTDAGTEFFNSHFDKLMKRHKIIHFATGSQLHASIIERFNKSLKSKMWRYFTAKNTQRYLDVLQDLMDSYNNSYHRSIRMKPNEVTPEKTSQVFENLYGSIPLKKTLPKYKFREGDIVRISKYRGVFDKMYEQSFTDEYFIVTECIPREPVVYKLRDIHGEIIKGTFYEHEIQKVKINKNTVFHIDKILDKKKRNGTDFVLVRWRGWPSRFDSWIPAKDVLDLQKEERKGKKKM